MTERRGVHQILCEYTLALLAFLAACKPIVDLDLSWHLAAGRWIVQNRSFIRTDPFSFTSLGQPWTSMTWLYELVCFALYHFGGYVPVTLFHAAMAAGAFVAAWKTFETLSPKETGTTGVVNRGLIFSFFLCVIPWLEFRWIDRPEVLTHFFGAIFLLMLVKIWTGWKGRFWFLPIFPILQVLWVNSHGLFVFGPIFCVTFAFFAWLLDGTSPRSKRFASLALAVIAACFVNPYGTRGVIWPIHLFAVLRDPTLRNTIPEATDPFLDGVWTYQAWGVLAFVLLALVLSVLHALKRPRRYWQDLGPAWPLLFAALAYLAVSARRNIPLLFLWTSPWIATLMLEQVRLLRFSNGRALNWSFIPASALALALVIPRVGFRPAPNYFPEGAVEFLLNSERPLRLFGTVELNDYLIERVPGFQSYLDGRFAELYTVGSLQRYMDILAYPPRFEDEADRWNLDGAMIGLSPPLGLGLIRYLSRSQRWKLARIDSTSVIFLKSRDPIPVDKVAPGSDGAGKDQARAWAQLAQLEIAVGDPEPAREHLAKALELDALSPIALENQCDYSALSHSKEALADCSRALVAGASPVAVHQALGLILLDQKKADAAAWHFRQVVRRDPMSFEGQWMLGRSLALLGDSRKILEMRQAYRQAMRLRPDNPEPERELESIEAQIHDSH